MELRPNLRRLEALIDIAQHARDRGESDAGLHALVASITQALRADRSTLYLVDEGSGELRSRVVEGAEGLDIRVKVGVGLAGWVAMTGVPLVINDVLADDRFDARWDRKSGYRTQTALVVPIPGEPPATADDAPGVLGVIQCLNKSGGFSDEDRKLLEGIAAVTGLAVERARLAD